MSQKTKTLISVFVTVIVIGLAYAYRVGVTKERATLEAEVPAVLGELKQPPVLGEEGSTHMHAPFAMFVNGELYNFTRPKYMLRDKKAHFEDNDGTVIHKHATGVTLPYFLGTLGIDLTDTCFYLDQTTKYCNDGNKKVTLLVNGKRITHVNNYEIQQNDKILLNYGDEDDTLLKLRSNNIPDLPTNL